MAKYSKKLSDRRASLLGHKKWLKQMKRNRRKSSGVRQYQYKDRLKKQLDFNLTCNNFSNKPAPKMFSLLDNPEEVLTYFKDIYWNIEQGNPTKIDISDVSDISIESLVNILAMFERFNSKGVPYHIEGNLPKDSKCRDLVINSGFLKHVRAGTSANSIDLKFFQIRSGDNTNTDVAKKICCFLMEKLLYSRIQVSPVYETLIEMMSNTFHHAYKSGKNKKVHKWYLGANFYEESKCVNIVFFDTGLGIPKTVSKSVSEKIRKYGEKITFGYFKERHADLINSCLNGQFRTQTMKENRGKGLPRIFKFSQESFVNKFTILSGRGLVQIDNNKKCDLENQFSGTLYSWNMNSK